ncbi:unnamed protein product, partial [Lymnaea stagnalis]
PVCPKNLTIKLTSPDTVSLSWKYGSHDGLQPTFTIFRHDESPGGSQDSRTKVAEVNGTKEDDMEYNITGLSKLSRYSFSLGVRNKAGERACPEVSVNVTTDAGEVSTAIIPMRRSGPNAVPIIISIACLLLLAIIIVIIVLIIRRRQGGYKTGHHSSVPTVDSAHVNAAYTECVPTEPNVEHPYQQFVPDSSGDVIWTSTDDGYLLPNDCVPSVEQTNADGALFLSQLPVSSNESEYEQLEDQIFS